MPRFFTRRDSLARRSNASLPGSRSSLNRHGSRRASMGNNQIASQYSLRRSSMNDGSSQSSSNTLRQHLGHLQDMQQQSKQNAVWNIEDQGSVSHPPSLVPSDTSMETEEQSMSRSSSQSSLQPPSQGRMNQSPNGTRYDGLRQYYAMRRLTVQNPNPTSNPNSPRIHCHATALRRSSLPTTTNRSLPGSPSQGSSSFLPQACKAQGDAWGQFVDTADAEEELARRRKLLSLTRMYNATMSRSEPTCHRLRRN